MKKGFVYLVGAGPGAPGLITVRGSEVLKRADVVIYDNLCNTYLLREVPRFAKYIFAGKHSGLATISQEKIENIMVQFAKQGKVVVRLKGGDPFVFGRGAEEAATLTQNRIPFEIVPGITSAIAVPAYAGIPVTHREYSSGLAIVTAYEDPSKNEAILDYEVLAKFPGTLLFLMGVKRLQGMAEKLIQFGKSPNTPAAIIRWGTRSIQKTLVGKLSSIYSIAQKADFRPPAVIVVGDVVKCRKEIQWFEKKPLFGKRVVVTRTREQASEFSSKFQELGAEVIELPTIEIKPVQSKLIDRAVHSVSKWDWVIFTSPWAAKIFFDKVLSLHHDIRVLKNTKFAAIGTATAVKVLERGLPVTLQPKVRTSKGLIKEIERYKNWENQNVLLPQSEIASDLVVKKLKSLKAKVEPIVFYRNLPSKLTWEIDALERMGADIITFASSSSVNNFVKLLKNNTFSKPLKDELKACKWVSIGPETSKAIHQNGYKVWGESNSSIEGMIDIIESI
jgi:uroporphyrinogen III methyltransferase/synthase